MNNDNDINDLGALAALVSTNLNTIDSSFLDPSSREKNKANRINPRELFQKAKTQRRDIAQQLVNENNPIIQKSIPKEFQHSVEPSNSGPIYTNKEIAQEQNNQIIQLELPLEPGKIKDIFEKMQDSFKKQESMQLSIINLLTEIRNTLKTK